MISVLIDGVLMNKPERLMDIGLVLVLDPSKYHRQQHVTFDMIDYRATAEINGFEFIETDDPEVVEFYADAGCDTTLKRNLNAAQCL